MADSGIATVAGADSATVQALFAAAIARWRRDGVRVAAVVAEAHGLPDRTCAAGFLRDLTSGVAYPIHLESPPPGTSCHLDVRGIDAACAAILPLIGTSDLVVLSKFGKLETTGGGLFAAFEAARAAGRPILTTVSPKHHAAWQAFAPGAAVLPADMDALRQWWRAQRSGAPAVDMAANTVSGA